jgi:hypothetical protein
LRVVVGAAGVSHAHLDDLRKCWAEDLPDRRGLLVE